MVVLTWMNKLRSGSCYEIQSESLDPFNVTNSLSVDPCTKGMMLHSLCTGTTTTQPDFTTPTPEVFWPGICLFHRLILLSEHSGLVFCARSSLACLKQATCFGVTNGNRVATLISTAQSADLLRNHNFTLSDFIWPRTKPSLLPLMLLSSHCSSYSQARNTLVTCLGQYTTTTQ